MSSADSVVLALDVGGTKLLGGLVDPSGGIRVRRSLPTPREAGRCDPGLATLAALATDLVGDAAGLGLEVGAVGVGFAEYVGAGGLSSAEVFAWDRQPAEVLGELPGLVGLPIVVAADVTCAAVAESARRAEPDFFYVSWGTGLSTSWVVDGRCHTGRRGEAIALGEWPVDPRGGQVWAGSLEELASGRGVQRRYADATGRWHEGGEIDELARGGDRTAASVIATAGDALARALVAVVQVLDPTVVVLGGGVGTSGGLLPASVVEGVARLSLRPDPPDVVVAQAGADAGLLGAAQLAWERLGHPRR